MKLQDLKNQIIELKRTEKSYQDIRFCDARDDAFQTKMAKISEYADAICEYFGDDAKDMEQLVKRLGGRIECFSAPLIDSSSLISRLELMDRLHDGFIIHVNQEWCPEYTIMEITIQLGYLFLHTNYLEAMNSGENPTLVSYYDENALFADSTEFIEVDEFAKILLMPTNEFMQFAKTHKPANIEEIAAHFHVSEDIVEMRGKNLGLIKS